MAKNNRSSAAVSRNEVSKTLVNRPPPQKRHDSAGDSSLVYAMACSSMAGAWNRTPIGSIGGPAWADWYPGSTRGRSDQAHDLRRVAPEALEAVELAFLGGEEVDDHRAEVEKDPASRTLPLNAERAN